MVEKRNLERFTNLASSRAVVKSILLKSLSDPNYFNRIEAVSGLAELGDSDVIPVLQNVAITDPYSDTHPNVNGSRYPVRDKAQKALNELAATRYQ